MQVTGLNTSIVRELAEMLDDEPIDRIDLARLDEPIDRIDLARPESRYVLAAGVLRPKHVLDQAESEIAETFAVNASHVISLCELILKENSRARICVVGSMSGIHGSYDMAYAAAKAGVHQYVKTRSLKSKHQQLVCVAPAFIEDSGMTQRRLDLEKLKERAKTFPKGRMLKARDVAKLVHFLLYIDSGHITNTVVEMSGGLWATR